MSEELGEGVHKQNNRQTFDALVAEAKENNGNPSIGERIPLKSDADLTDNFEAEDEKKRSHSISTILDYYGESYKNKVVFQQLYRKILFWGCAGVIVIFCAVVLITICRTFKIAGNLKVTDAVAIVSVLVTCSAAVWELIKIVTKYCFPENDEEYIVKIVESIQHNDLEKYKEKNRTTEARENSQKPK